MTTASAPAPPRPQAAGTSLLGLMFLVGIFGILSWLFAPLFHSSGPGPLRDVLIVLLAISIASLPLFSIGLISILIHRNRSQRDMALWMLELAADRGIPLAPSLHTVAGTCSRGRLLRTLLCFALFPLTLPLGLAAIVLNWGNLRIRALRVADALETGMDLPDALRLNRGLVGPAEELLARIGSQSGRLAEGLHLGSEHRRARRTIRSAIVGKATYILFVLAAFVVSMTLISVRFAPQLTRIYSEFGIRMPPWNDVTLFFADLWADGWGIAIVAAAFAAAFLIAILSSLDLRRPPLPGLDRIFQRLDRSLVLRALALGVEGGLPLTTTVASLVQWHHKNWVRRRLIFAYPEIASGGDWTEALRAVGLISRPEAKLLAAAERAGNLAWALREAADAGDRRFLHRVRVWSQVAFTVMLLAIGVLLLFYALTYLGPILIMSERMPTS